MTRLPCLLRLFSVFQTSGSAKMGQRNGFAASDLAKINAMYCRGQNQRPNRPQRPPNNIQRPNVFPTNPMGPQGPANRPGGPRPNPNQPPLYPEPDYYPDYYYGFGPPRPNRPPPGYGGPFPPSYPDYGLYG